MLLIIVTGMGGAGVSTVAAWTAGVCAAKGRRVALLDISGGPPSPHSSTAPMRVEPRAELERWPAVAAWLAELAGGGGAAALAAGLGAPGIADIMMLLAVDRVLTSEAHDLAVLDAPPLGAAHRLLTLPALVAKLNPSVPRGGGGRVARTLARHLIDAPLPPGDALEELASWLQRLAALAATLADAGSTAVRAVLRGGPQASDSGRSMLAPLTLSGLPLDMVYIAERNRDGGETERRLAETLHPIPVCAWPPATTGDPGQPGMRTPPLRLETTSAGGRLMLPLPLQTRAELTLRQHGDRVVITAGAASRELPVPPAFRGRRCTGATYDGTTLTLAFEAGLVASS